MFKYAVAAFLAVSSVSSTLVLDARFKNIPSSSTFDSSSSIYQTYIRGSQPASYYLPLSSSYKNPADSEETQGVALTLDQTSLWNNQNNFRRTEIIPAQPSPGSQTTGTYYYHLSMKMDASNPMSTDVEHQLLFHERDSDYTQNFGCRYGASAGTNLICYIEDNSGNRVTKFTTALGTSNWHNFVFEVNFSTKNVAFWHSLNDAQLTQVASGSCPRLGGGWFHIGQLKMVANTNSFKEVLYFSSVLVTKDTMDSWLSGSVSTTTTRTTTTTTRTTTTTTRPPTTTTTTTQPPVGNCGTQTVTITNRPTVTSVQTVTVGGQQSSTTRTTTTTTTTSGGSTNCSGKYAQCGGIGFSGATCCVSGSTCTRSNDYYSQCL